MRRSFIPVRRTAIQATNDEFCNITIQTIIIQENELPDIDYHTEKQLKPAPNQ